jgi:hypothetical protein
MLLFCFIYCVLYKSGFLLCRKLLKRRDTPIIKHMHIDDSHRSDWKSRAWPWRDLYSIWVYELNDPILQKVFYQK